MAFKNQVKLSQDRLRRPTKMIRSGFPNDEPSAIEAYENMKLKLKSIDDRAALAKACGDTGRARLLNLERVEICKELGKLRDRVKWWKQCERPIQDYFMDIVREDLPKYQIDMLWNKAVARAQKAKEEAKQKLDNERLRIDD